MSRAAEPFFRVGLRCPLQPLICKVLGFWGIQGPSFSTELLVRQLQSSSLSFVCLIAAGLLGERCNTRRGGVFATKSWKAKPASRGSPGSLMSQDCTFLGLLMPR